MLGIVVLMITTMFMIVSVGASISAHKINKDTRKKLEELEAINETTTTPNTNHFTF